MCDVKETLTVQVQTERQIPQFDHQRVGQEKRRVEGWLDAQESRIMAGKFSIAEGKDPVEDVP